MAAVAVAAVAAAATAGCGLGPGESSEGEAHLTVTREYGTVPMVEATIEDPPESETVIRALDGAAEITTRFEGRFVHSIDGVAGEIEDGRSRDWFFYVNGIESSQGAADVGVSAGDRIWWDYRDWTEALRAPAVVGSWPKPFAGESVAVECAATPAPCRDVAERLEAEGVEPTVDDHPVAGDSADGPRMLVGQWASIEGDPAARLLAEPPDASGVFARFERTPPGPVLVILDERAEETRRLGRGAGLVAAVRDGEDPPTWLVTGTDAAGVEAAVAALATESLEHRYAVAVRGEARIPVPDLANGELAE
jgi:hypothetical protein